MTLHLLQDRTIGETQKDLNDIYPFLKIEFYNKTDPASARCRLNNTILLAAAGLKKNGDLEITDSMTAADLEKIFREQLGLRVQVSRLSGNVWLEPTITDSWTLKQQNAHGSELAEPIDNIIAIKGCHRKCDQCLNKEGF